MTKNKRFRRRKGRWKRRIPDELVQAVDSGNKAYQVLITSALLHLITVKNNVATWISQQLASYPVVAATASSIIGITFLARRLLEHAH